jgi:hypothetical protein
VATFDDLSATLGEVRNRLQTIQDGRQLNAAPLNMAMAELHEELGDLTAIEIWASSEAEIERLHRKATRVLELMPVAA